MKPSEFWNCTYREINVFTQANLCKMTDQFRQDIALQEAVTDKLILSDAMSNKRPKIISLHETFKNLFPQNSQNEEQSAKEITRRMRQLMKIDKI